MDTMSDAGFWRLAAKHARSGLGEMHRSFSKKAFVRGLQKLAPEIREEDLVTGAAGVRAQALRPDGSLVNDFLIVHSPSAVPVCDAPSPAATASLEIGKVVAKYLGVPWRRDPLNAAAGQNLEPCVAQRALSCKS